MGLPPSLEVVWGFVSGGLSAEQGVKAVFYSTGAGQTHLVFREADSHELFHCTLPCLPRRAAMTSRSRGRQQWYSIPALMRHRAYFSCSALSLPSAAFNSQKMTPRDGTEVETRTRSGNPLPSDRHTPGRGDDGEAWNTSHCCIRASLITWSWNIFSETVIGSLFPIRTRT